jgi:hypothetical protein
MPVLVTEAFGRFSDDPQKGAAQPTQASPGWCGEGQTGVSSLTISKR